MDINDIRARIVSKQELINVEDDQTRKNELLQDLRILQMRLDMEQTKEKINHIKSNK